MRSFGPSILPRALMLIGLTSAGAIMVGVAVTDARHAAYGAVAVPYGLAHAGRADVAVTAPHINLSIGNHPVVRVGVSHRDLRCLVDLRPVFRVNFAPVLWKPLRKECWSVRVAGTETRTQEGSVP